MFVNKTALSDLNIPLPINENEQIISVFENVELVYKQSEIEFFHENNGGNLYLTNLRLVYVSKNDLLTFYIPLNRILKCKNPWIEFMNIDNTLNYICIKFWYKTGFLFFDELKNILSETEVDIVEDNEDNLPYYSELFN